MRRSRHALIAVAMLAAIPALGARDAMLQVAPDGALLLPLGEGLLARDFAEVRDDSGAWSALSPDPGVTPTPDGLQVSPAPGAAGLSREVHWLPGQVIMIWRAPALPGPERGWRVGVRLPEGAAPIAADARDEWVAGNSLRNARFTMGRGRIQAEMAGEGTWGTERLGDSAVLAYCQPAGPDQSLGAVLRLSYGPAAQREATWTGPLQLLDWLTGPVALSARMAHPGLYYSGEALAVDLRADALQTRRGALPVRVRVLGYAGETLEQTETKLAGDRAQVQTRVLLRTRQPGMYRVEVTCGDRRREVTVGVIPRPRAGVVATASVFGGHWGPSGRCGPALAEQLGLHWLRLWDAQSGGPVAWARVEPKHGQFDWSGAGVPTARPGSHELLGVLGGELPDWVGQDPAQWLPRDLEAWRSYVAATVTQLRGQVRYWEVMNEPWRVFGGDAAAYVRVLKVAWEAARAVDPLCRIVGTGCPSGFPAWSEAVFAAGGLQYQDIVSARLCPPGAGDTLLDADEFVREFMGELRQSMRRYGAEKPIWATTCGLVPVTRFGAAPASGPGAGEISFALATDMAARLCVVHAAEGVRLFHSQLPGTGSALCDEAGVAQPAAAAVAVSAGVVDGARFARCIAKGFLRAYVFRRDDEGVIVVWGVGLEGRRSALDLPLRNCEVRGVLGARVSLPLVEGKVRLPVTPSPLYITCPANRLDEAVRAFREAPPPEVAD